MGVKLEIVGKGVGLVQIGIAQIRIEVIGALLGPSQSVADAKCVAGQKARQIDQKPAIRRLYHTLARPNRRGRKRLAHGSLFGGATVRGAKGGVLQFGEHFFAAATEDQQLGLGRR